MIGIKDVIKSARKAGIKIDKKNPIRETKFEDNKIIYILNVEPQKIQIKAEVYHEQ